jgi:hypothetical protein
MSDLHMFFSQGPYGYHPAFALWILRMPSFTSLASAHAHPCLYQKKARTISPGIYIIILQEVSCSVIRLQRPPFAGPPYHLGPPTP